VNNLWPPAGPSLAQGGGTFGSAGRERRLEEAVSSLEEAAELQVMDDPSLVYDTSQKKY